jgi:hypothetical protein
MSKLTEQSFHEAGYKKWTIKHAFFADMGGFFVKPPDDDLPSFPLDAKQLYTLVKDEYLVFPNLEEEEIEDRNKSGGLARLVQDYLTSYLPLYILYLPR